MTKQLIMKFYLAENTPGEDLLWILSDNFVATTFRPHFKKYVPPAGEDSCFIKSNFEMVAFCGSRYSSSQTNILARLQNALAAGINAAKKTGWLPKYIIVVLDKDLVSYLDFVDEGAATILGTWIEWIADQFADLVQQRLNQVPLKAKKVVPFFYWVAAPTHGSFSYKENQGRIKFNLGLEAVI